MSKRKWNLTDAAIARIEKRMMTMRKEDDKQEWYFKPMALLLKAMEPENYARPQSAAEGLIQIWIRDGEQLWLCAAIFEHYARERRELREAGSNTMNGIRAMGRMRL